MDTIKTSRLDSLDADYITRLSNRFKGCFISEGILEEAIKGNDSMNVISNDIPKSHEIKSELEAEGYKVEMLRETEEEIEYRISW